MTEQTANEAGENLGDEYFAELDYIEVVEKIKEGYEEDVEMSASSADDEDFDIEKESKAHNEDSDDEFVTRNYSAADSAFKKRYRTRNSVDTLRKSSAQAAVKQKEIKEKAKERENSLSDDEENVRQVKNFMASNTMSLNDEPDEEPVKSTRKFYDKDESVYIMDAKKAGNIGRYFNVSKV